MELAEKHAHRQPSSYKYHNKEVQAEVRLSVELSLLIPRSLQARGYACLGFVSLSMLSRLSCLL